MHRKVRAHIARTLGLDAVLEKPKERSFGHFATPLAFSVAKEQRQPPHLIAQSLAATLMEDTLFAKVEPLKGYVNFTLSDSFLDSYATWALQNPDSFGRGNHTQTLLLEYVSANPTGPLHIGHARGAVLGDALLRIGRHLGYQITSEYYINDAGNQIHLLGLSIYLSGRARILGLPVTWPEEYYKGEYIDVIAQDAAKTLGTDVFADESGIARLSEFGKEQMLEEIRRNLGAVGISFDHYVSERGLYGDWERVRAKLENHEALYREGEKIWLRSSAHGDEKDRVVVRENGEPTYLAGDIIYHNDKFERGFEHYINIWGADHHGYIARVKAAVAFLGYDQGRLEILLSQMVALLKGGEPFRMSKRAGNFILMRDVVEEIGSDALRLIFLSKKADTPLEFDVDSLKKQDASNPVFYINYAHARIHTLFSKAQISMESICEVPLVGLHDDAKDLLFSALSLPQVLEDAFEARQVQKLTDYLKQLAAEYHKFYNDHKILGEPHERAYLKISAAVALSIKTGLSLLGVTAQTRM